MRTNEGLLQCGLHLHVLVLADVCEGINHATAFLVPLAEIVEQVTLDQENEASPS